LLHHREPGMIKMTISPHILMKQLIPKCKIAKMDYKDKFFQGWYLKACALGIEFLRAKVPKELFNCDPFDLHVPFDDIHTLYCFQRLDATLITFWCM
jgi:hypothetical protein